METVAGMTDLQIKLFTAIGQIAVACIVGYIAWQQWQTAKKKLKADLFEKRFNTYRQLVSAVEQLCDIPIDSKEQPSFGHDAGPASLAQVERLGHEASWLFDTAISNLIIQTMVPHAEHVADWRSKWTGTSSTVLRDRFRNEALMAAGPLQAKLEEVTHLVGPYLELQH